MFYFEREDRIEAFGEDENYKKLLHYYNKIESISGDRVKNSGDKLKEFDLYISKIDKRYPYPDDGTLNRTVSMVKGDAMLRKAQVLDAEFENSEECYREAALLLEKAYKIDEYSLLNMLTLLNLGKYLRNTGTLGHRSDFDRALDCFKELQEYIEKALKRDSGIRKMSRWETCLWLEARINIGRIHKYLYRLEEAKFDFLDILLILLDQRIESHEQIHGTIRDDCLLNRDINDKEAKKSLWIINYFWENRRNYKDYLQQVLVELGTVYLKERNLEAAKNLFILTHKINKDNVDAKNNIGVYLRKRNRPGDYKKAVQILKQQADDGNHFAKINILKCQIGLLEDKNKTNDEEEEDSEIKNILDECKMYDEEAVFGEDIKVKLDNMIKKQPKDLKLKLLLGVFYKKKKSWDAALKEFNYIYKKASYIRKGTIGLKAYYNIIQELIRRKQFYQAKAGLEQIITECGRDFKDDSQQIDFLAEMDLGWCLLNIGYYEKARNCYEKILRDEDKRKKQDVRYTTKTWNQTRVLNNLGMCYLYLGKNEKAREKFEEVLKMEPNNSRANRSLGQYYGQLARKYENIKDYANAKRNLELAIEKFKEAAYEESDDIKINSGLVIAQCKIYGKKYGRESKWENDIEKSLRYSNKSFSMRACFSFANFIEEANEEKKDVLYRSFARIKLGTDEEAYDTFEHFRKENAIRRLPTESRGKIFAKMLQIYEKVLEVKKMCRYTPKKIEEKEETALVHYTKLNTLKILLDKKADDNKNPRLRLWNTAYMNDSFEGEVFIELLKEVSGQTKEEKEEAAGILSRYFKHLSNSSDGLVPSNGNVYVISFSMRKDSIPMWNAYAEDAKGCSITFEDDFFDIKNETDMYTGISSYSDKSYLLYKVLYLNSKEDSTETTNSDKLKEVKMYLKEIWNLLIKFEKYLNEEIEACKNRGLWEEAIGISRKYIADYLNEIRFLFKYNEYSYEEEVGLIKCSYESQLDKDNFKVPRLYIEVDKDINRLKEVCLGKKISQTDMSQIVSWLYSTKMVENVTVSSRHYQ